MALGLYSSLCVYMLSQVGLWTIGLWKDTILWFFGAALVMAYQAVTASEVESLIKRAARDAFGLAVVISFLANTYTFPLGVELLMVPAFTLLGMIHVVAESRPEHRPVARAAEALLGVAGLGLLAFVLYRTLVDLEVMWSTDTLLGLGLPFVLSVAIVPFAHLLGLYAQYETLFLRLELGAEKPRDVRRYARWRVAAHVRLSRVRAQALLPGPRAGPHESAHPFRRRPLVRRRVGPGGSPTGANAP